MTETQQTTSQQNKGRAKDGREVEVGGEEEEKEEGKNERKKEREKAYKQETGHREAVYTHARLTTREHCVLFFRHHQQHSTSGFVFYLSRFSFAQRQTLSSADTSLIRLGLIPTLSYSPSLPCTLL